MKIIKKFVFLFSDKKKKKELFKKALNSSDIELVDLYLQTGFDINTELYYAMPIADETWQAYSVLPLDYVSGINEDKRVADFLRSRGGRSGREFL